MNNSWLTVNAFMLLSKWYQRWILPDFLGQSGPYFHCTLCHFTNLKNGINRCITMYPCISVDIRILSDRLDGWLLGFFQQWLGEFLQMLIEMFIVGRIHSSSHKSNFNRRLPIAANNWSQFATKQTRGSRRLEHFWQRVQHTQLNNKQTHHEVIIRHIDGCVCTKHKRTNPSIRLNKVGANKCEWAKNESCTEKNIWSQLEGDAVNCDKAGDAWRHKRDDILSKSCWIYKWYATDRRNQWILQCASFLKWFGSIFGAIVEHLRTDTSVSSTDAFWNEVPKLSLPDWLQLKTALQRKHVNCESN